MWPHAAWKSKVAPDPAVLCPLADLSGDGCNSQSDFLLAVGVHAGQTLNGLPAETINPGSDSRDENWLAHTYALKTRRRQNGVSRGQGGLSRSAHDLQRGSLL